MKNLSITTGKLRLPVDAVTNTFAILARKRVGKTYTGSVMAEEMYEAGIPWTAIDPTGAWWGLRSSADGKSPGIPVVVIGGAHGDVPLEPTAGKVIADLVVDRPGYYIIDLSAFESDAEQDRFCTDFATRFYRRKQKNRFAMHLFVDEADSVAPQKPFPGQQRMLGAYEAIVRRGGIYGIGVTMITQRPAVLNKNVLTQCETLIVLTMSAPQDQDAIDDWVRRNGTKEQRDEMMKSLASLKTGEAWIWSPSWLEVFEKVQIRERYTFNSSATPKHGEKVLLPEKMAEIDLDKLTEEIRSTIEKAKQNDPEELKRHISKLEKELKERSKFTLTNTLVPEPKIEIREIPVFNQEDVKRLMYIRDTQSTLLNESSLLLSKISESLDALLRKANEIETQNQVARLVTKIPPATKERYVHGTPKSNGSTETIKLGKGEQAQLFALMQHGSANRSRLRTITGYRKSSVDTHIKHLRTAGLVEEASGDIRPTTLAWDMFPQYEPLPQGEELIVYWLNNLSQGERAIFEFRLERPREWTSREDIRDKTGYAKSSVDTYIKHMRAKNIVEDRGSIRPHPNLYET